MTSLPAIWLPRAQLHLDPDFILQNCYARPGDIVVLAGTLVEGLGNCYSDLDVYVITEQYRSSTEIALQNHHRVLSVERDIIRADTAPCDVLLIHTVVPGTAIKVDVEYKTFADLHALFGKVKEIFRYATRNLILLTKRLTEREEVLIHRLFNCLPLRGASRLDTLMSGISKQEYLYIAYRWVASDFAIVLDLAGAWEAGELDRAVELARENVLIQTSAYLRLRGETNLRRKWLLPCLRRLADTDGIFAELDNLMYLRGTEDEEGKMRYVMRALDYVDNLFQLSAPLLAALPGVPTGAQGLALLSGERLEDQSGNAYADWEYAYRIKAYGAAGAPTRTRLRPRVATPANDATGRRTG